MTVILVTGGAGYIGSHACKALALSGHLPVALDDLSRGHAEAVQWGPLEKGDIGDAARLDAVFTKHRPGAVMHFAAITDVGASISSPASYYASNAVATLTLLDALRRHSVRHAIFSSTCAIYGEAPSLPVSEDAPALPINPYGFTKLIGERAFADYGRAYGIGSVALRYFNAAGADAAGENGERQEAPVMAVPRAIHAALGLGPVFHVYGTDFSTADGSAVRDYVHVCDIADAHVKALDYLMAGGDSTAFNLGSGSGTSVLEMLRAVERAAGRAVPFEPGPRRVGDPAALYASIDKAADVLSWYPRRSDIDTIVGSAVRWIRAQKC